MTIAALQSPRVRRWTKLLATFFAGQSLIQLINLVTGFLLLRWMTTTAYAQYSVAFAFQSTLNLLVDLGFSGSIVALVGDRGHDKAVVGEYIRCARHFRGRMFLILGVGSAVAFPLVTWNQPWGWGVKAALWSAIVCSVFFQGRMLYSAPLLIHGRLKDYYRAGLIPSIYRLTLSGVLYVTGALFGWVASWVNAGSLALQGFLYRKHSGDLVEEPERHQKETSAEMRRYLTPLWPGLIFFALQGQVSILLASLLGYDQTIASIGALGRLSQIFIALSAFNAIIIEPKLAKSSLDSLPRKIGIVVLASLLVSSLLVSLAYYYPTPILWLLGSKYMHLRGYLTVAIASAAIGYIASTIWIINSSRKWVSWPYTIGYIAITIGSQLTAGLSLNLTTLNGLVFWSLTAPIAALLSHSCATILFLRRQRHA